MIATPMTPAGGGLEGNRMRKLSLLMTAKELLAVLKRGELPTKEKVR
jgi:hypothetical protein